MRAVSSLPHRFNVSADARYLTAGQIRERFGGVSDMWIVRRLADSNFPKPIRFGGRPKSARHWRVTDIEAWEVERVRLSSGDRR